MAAASEPQAVTSPRYAAGDVIASKYRLESILGEGGMGAVWRAFNVQLDAPVAIKLIRADLDRELLTKRLKQEARAAAKLGHPAIVRIFDVGETELGDPFIVMELLNGRSLATLLANEHRLTAARAVQLLLPIAEALSVAHAKGIVHRDLKPDNVFIAVDNEQVQPKLVDFGIVKLSGQADEPAHLTQHGTVLGSPEYMSPEQARGRDDLDYRTDIWSFCIVLYEMLVGATPFTGANYNALLRSIVESKPPSIVDQLAGDDRLWEIIERGLTKEREHRFQSMTELGRALAGWLISQGVLEDVCGSSLEAKWITRASDPSAVRVSRASLASLATLPPESGVRIADRQLAATPTVDAAALSSAESSGINVRPATPWLTLPRAVLLGTAVILLAMILIAARKRPPAEDSSQAAEPSHAAAPPPASAASTPTSIVAVGSQIPRPEPSAAAPEVRATNVGGAAHHLPRKPKGGKVPSATQPSAATANGVPGDLLTPY